jgi:hypothetical protein
MLNIMYGSSLVNRTTFENSLNWLVNNAGLVIKYRAFSDLLHDENRLKSLHESLMRSGLVRFWLSNLRPDLGRNALHGAKTENYENVMGKLYEFGLRKGIPGLDNKTKPFRRWLEQQVGVSNEVYLPVFYRTLVAAFLILTGYADDRAVKDWVLRRLETTYDFAKEGNLENAYVPQDTFPSFPKAFRSTPLLNPELYPDDELKLPWIHDVNAFLHAPFIMEDDELRAKVETIVRFILDPDYQRLHVGYGVVRHQHGRYYMMGWSVHLPAFFEPDVPMKDFGRWLLLLKLLGRSRTAREHIWYKRSVEMLSRFKNEKGLINFPRESLPEKRSGCWVLGHRMALEENRRTARAITCESTFRFLEITSQNSQT